MANNLKNFGKLNIPDWIWWVGIVESRADITKAGRYKVRIMGYHISDPEVLPTKDLPYATVINSPTSAGVSGVMETPNLLPGSTVIGFFADGEDSQMPVILGSIAGYPRSKSENFIEDAFQDPTKTWPRGAFEEPAPEGWGGVDEPDIPRLARGDAAETHYSLITKRAEREIDIRTASAPSVEKDGILDDKTEKDYEGKTWEEPYARAKGPYKTFEMEEFEPKYWDAIADLKKGEDGNQGIPDEPGTYTSMYPFNKVKETESGFVEEIDNTVNNERYAFYHPVGNYEEVQADGTRINKIKGSDYEIIAEDKNVIIRGSCNVTIVGDAKMLVMGDKYEEVEGDYFLKIHGDRVTKITGNDVKSVTTDENTSIKGMRTVRVGLDDNETIIGKQTESVGKDKTETVVGNVTETFNANQYTMITKQSYLRAGSAYAHQSGGPMIQASGGDNTLTTSKNMKVEAAANMDIDANNMTIDAPTMSIDGPAGNITSNDVTLHTHTHPQNDGNDAGGGADTSAPNGGS